jgi:hypothetical protein
VYGSLVYSDSLVNPDAQFIIPILKSVSSASEYLKLLVTFNTLDIHPVRDLSLLIDIKIFDWTGFNPTIFHNLLLWVGIGWIIDLFIKKMFPTIGDQERLLIVLCFLVYPLFTQSVSWGVARKHLLALLFALIASYKAISIDKPYRYEDSLFFNFFYTCAILSQPITLLLPFWLGLYVYLKRPRLLKSALKMFVPGFIIFVIVLLVNYAYYESSHIFLTSYGPKTNEMLELSDKILALGHYIFQLFFPYLLSFTYTLGHWSTLAGLILLGVLSYIILGFKIDKREIIIWGAFIILPLSIILLKSSTLYDTCLLLPAFGVLILLLKIREKLGDIQWKLPLFGLILFWTSYSHYEVRGWRDEVVLMEKGFKRRPTCLTAFGYLKMSYENNRPPETATARRFLYNYECDKFEMRGQHMLNMHAYLLYYENDLPQEDRIARLEKISEVAILPGMALAALYLKLNETQKARATIKELVNRWGQKRYKSEKILIASEVLNPFCVREGNLECQKLLQPFIHEKESIFYK